MERWRDMNKKLKLKIHESLSAVIPITLIVLALGMTVVPMELSTLMLFLAGAALLILGMGFFTLGADMAMMPIGEQVGTQLTRSKRLWLIVAACFVIGVIITVAEPDLQVLARQTPAVPDRVLIFTVAAGVGFFLVVSFLRILFGWNLSWLLIGFYIVVFALAAFVPDAFLAVAFDSGGVTTGPITVPFIMALGLGLTAVRGDKNAESDSFGLVALCSIGPILSVLILGMIYNPEGAGYTPLSIPDIASTRELWLELRERGPAGAGTHPRVFRGVSGLLPEAAPQGSGKDPGGHAVHAGGADAVPDGRERGLYARGQLHRKAAGRAAL